MSPADAPAHAPSSISSSDDPLDVSIVVPVYNEEGNVEALLDEIVAAPFARPPREIIFVDDCSDDATGQRLIAARARVPTLRIIRHDRRSGQSAALRTGVRAARGAWVATLDGDGQNDPADIPRLLAAAAENPAQPALVAGLRLNRRDTLSKRLASRFANRIRQGLLRDGCVDSGCGIKAFRRSAFFDLPYFGALHRFTPALFQIQGHRVAYLPVGHRPRLSGRSKYTNLRRGLIGIVDLLGVAWLARRTHLPSAAREQ